VNRILIVDDREESRYLLNRVLESGGHKVEEASNGAEALEKARQNPPHLIVSDLLMPVMDGYTLLRHWRTDDRLKQIPFIVYTATYVDPKDEQLALSLGADAFLLKPAEPADLIARVKQVLAIAACGQAPSPASSMPTRIPVSAPEEEDTRNFRNYSEVLIRKLEDKMEALDKANRQLERELTERQQADTRIRRLNRVYAVLSGINHTIVRESSLEAMLAAACRIAVEMGGFRMAWIGLADLPAKQVRLAAHAEAADAPGLREVILDNGQPGCGCAFTVQALQTGRHAVCNDVAHDPLTVPWREAALQRNCQAMAALPLKSGDKVTGVFSLYAGETGIFDEEEMRLLEELVMDISFAIEVVRREEDRRRVDEANTRLATAVEQSTEMIIITDVKATILYVNPAFEKVTGYSRQEAIGRNPRFLQSGKHDTAFYRQLWETLTRGEVWTGHFINKNKSGAIQEEEASISPIRDPAGGIVNYVAVKHDVTQEMALEAQLRQAQKIEAIGQLASGVAHDFNNILTAIHGNASLLLFPGLLPEERSDCIQQIIQASERAASLTRQLLLFSRKQVIQPANLDLNEVVVGLIKMLNRILGEDIILCSELHPALPCLYADAGMIEQVLLNLAVNSRDAMPAGGRLTITTGAQTLDEEQARQNPEAAAGEHVFLEVADTGSGIPPEVMPRIFEPFFTTKEAGKGTGLGLATVHGIVKQHRGWITVTSETGRGATFRVYLPATRKSQAVPQKGEAMARLPGGNETILIVEDEASLRLLMGNVLQRCGYTVLRAESGVAALKIWNECKQPVHLLFTDLVMPDGMSGFDLADRLHAGHPELKVIFTSGYSARAGTGVPLVEGQNFLQKPYSSQKLALTVRNSLDQGR
jgi:PAS domain S-box-containing protein